MERNPYDDTSTTVRDLLGTRPPRLLLYSTLALVVLIALVLAAGFIVQIPESVTGKMVVTTSEPPLSIVAPREGYISSLRVSDRQKVQKGEILAMYASSARLEDVLMLEKEIEQLSEFDPDGLKRYSPSRSLQLGELSLAYNNFLNAFEFLPLELNKLGGNLPAAIPSSKEGSIRNSLDYQKQRLERIDRQLDSLRRKFNIALRNYEQTSNEIFAEEQLKANEGIEKLKSEREQVMLEIKRLERDLLDAKASRLESQLRQQEGIQSNLYRLKQELANLRSAIATWKEQYLITAPRQGTVFLFGGLAANTFVSRGQQLMVILPDSEDIRYLAQVTIPARGSGKVKEGQEVLLRFDAYAPTEFGIVKGLVSRISPAPSGGSYIVEVDLPQGLITSRGYRIDFSYQLTGTAEIFTERQVLYAYLFEEFGRR